MAGFPCTAGLAMFFSRFFFAFRLFFIGDCTFFTNMLFLIIFYVRSRVPYNHSLEKLGVFLGGSA
jgi:hypothetical protein